MFLVLHGQTEWNLAGRMQGHGDSPLTDEGRRQASVAATTLARHLPDASRVQIISSPSGRTRATAAIIANALGTPASAIRYEPRIMEVHLGAWEGMTREDIEADWSALLEGTTYQDWFFRAPGGEDYLATANRIGDWLSAIDNHDSLIVVSHGVASRILRGLYVGHSKEVALQLEIMRDAVFRLANGTIEKLTDP
jgi:broad specificity phosphatase PhoE